MKAITELRKENVVLLPATIDYYQVELTKMLETDRYGQAKATLRFLIGCHGVDERTKAEWQSILDWLEEMYPGNSGGRAVTEKEQTEADFLEQFTSVRKETDSGYAEQLVALFEERQALDRQLAVLDQLRYVEHPRLNDVLSEWLSEQRLPGPIQWKTLQILKWRGATGSICLPKNGEIVVLDLQDTPLSQEELPANVRDIISRMLEISGVKQPDLRQFAEQTWLEFVAYAYGTSVFRRLLALEDDETDAWSAALHDMLLRRMTGSADSTEIRELYGITERLRPAWDEAGGVFSRFAERVFPSLG